MLRDKDIREPLFEFLEMKYGKTRFIEEKTMGRSRADVVMVLPEELVGIEIKSDADTYARLASQVKDYDKYYDKNIVVVGSSHAAHIDEHVPEYWGIISAEIIGDEFDFYVLREPLSNPKRKLKRKLEILWRPELAMLQEWNAMPKYKTSSKDTVIAKIIERVDKGKIQFTDLQKQISDILFERDYNHVEELLSEYRKGELQKQIENETDPEKKAELMNRQAQLQKREFKKRRRRRKRSSQ